MTTLISNTYYYGKRIKNMQKANLEKKENTMYYKAIRTVEKRETNKQLGVLNGSNQP